MKKTKKKIYAGSLILKILVILAAVFTLVMLGYLIVYILAKGIPHLTPSLFSIHYDSDNVSMLPSIIYRICIILYVVFRNCLPHVLFFNGRYFNSSDHGSANGFENHRGSTFSSSG